MNIVNANIALVHDWYLKQSIGGAEQVTLIVDELLSKNYSMPELFSLTENICKNHKSFFGDRKINTSFIQKLPFGKDNVQKYLPIIPFAIEQLDLRSYDLIISSSHAFAKGVITSPYQLHISYVHTPMRYAWDQMNTYLSHSNLSKYGFEMPLRYILYKLREWDVHSSVRVDHLISNSNFTAKRIKKYWGLETEVINPPVAVERFECNKNRENFYLSVNRLVPNKRIDLLINAFNKLGLPLIVIGDGPERNKLEKIAKANIKFLKNIPNKEVADYMSRCRSFVYAGLEDFGIAPVEAMAAGAPVIAYGRGGILDTVNCLTSHESNAMPNGILFKKQTSNDIIDSINWFEEKKIWKQFNPQNLNDYSYNFSKEKFTSKLNSLINKLWEDFQK